MAPARVTPLEVAVDNQEADGDGTDNDQKETYSPDRRKVARRVSRRISNSADVNEQSAEDAADTVREGTQASFFRDQFTPPGFISSNSAFQERWDVVLLLLLLFVMVVTPFEVCFLEAQSVSTPLFWINRFVDACFVVDMCCQFRLVGPEVNLQQLVTKDGDTSALKWELMMIYMKSWFPIDFLSILPYDLLTWLIERDFPNANLEMLRLLRVIRLARLAKILRVMRASRIIARYDDRVGISFVKARIVTYILIVVFCSHWLACILKLTVVIEADESANWILAYFGHNDVNPGTQYIAAWYWAIMTMSSVGFGDILPQTDAERLVAAFVMLMGACLFAFLLGSVTSLVAALDERNQEYMYIREHLNEFCESADLPQKLRYKLRHYVRSRFQTGALFDWSQVLEHLSSQLQEEVASFVHASLFRENPFFAGAEPDECATVASKIKQRSFPEGESLIVPFEKAHSLYFLKKGLVLSEGELYDTGKIVGLDCLYFSVRYATEDLSATEGSAAQVVSMQQGLKSTSMYALGVLAVQRADRSFLSKQAFNEVRDYRAVSMCFTIANEIILEDMLKVFQSHPRLLHHIRRVVVKRTMRMHVLAYAKAYARVYKEPQHAKLLKMAMNTNLVSWYERKLQMTATYEKPESMQQILILQRNLRTFVQKTRFRKVCRLIRQDPQMMHKQLLQQIQQIQKGGGANRTGSPTAGSSYMSQVQPLQTLQTGSLSEAQHQLQMAMTSASMAEANIQSCTDGRMKKVWENAMAQQADIVNGLSRKVNELMAEEAR